MAGNIVVVVNPASDLLEVTASAISKVFMGKSSKVADSKVSPIDQSSDQPARIGFSKKILGRSVAKVEKYWKKIILSGKGQPPQSVSGDDEVIAFVMKNKNAIGYISSDKVTDEVKVLKVDGQKEW
jgi:ABC-type phosphate transport system substrate-binding protein